MRVEWRCALVVTGAQYVIMSGTRMMPQLSAVNWATPMKVCKMPYFINVVYNTHYRCYK